ncbi:MAG: hypothetical protein ACO21X_05710 [Sediminibacterium sp.]
MTGILHAQKRSKSKAPPGVLVQKMIVSEPDEIPIVVLDPDTKNGLEPSFVASSLHANKDPFYNTASFGFAAAGFMIKGLDASFSQTLFNGLPIKSLLTGSPHFAVYSGLQQMMRKTLVLDGIAGNELSFGSLGNTTGADIRAVVMPKQSKIAVTIANRAYSHKYVVQMSTGELKNGWAFAAHLNARLAKEGYYSGCGYEGYGYMLSVDKKLKTRTVLSLSLLGAPIAAERQAPVLQESLQYFGAYYNPNWGMQNGLKRNAVKSTTHLPTVIFSAALPLPQAQKLNIAIGCTMGVKSITGLDWNSAADPRADYYKYLPSYYQDSALRALMHDNLLQNPDKGQLDWTGMYTLNAISNEPVIVSGNPNVVLQKRAAVILENRMDAQQILMGSLVYQSPIGNVGLFTAGINAQFERHHFYKKVQDLLGAHYYVNINQFAEDALQIRTDVNQFDIENPNQIILQHQNFGYNYVAKFLQTTAFMQSSWAFARFDVFAGLQLTGNRFNRVGLVKNGLFPLQSKGPSYTYHFTSPEAKLGVTYKLNGRHYFSVELLSGARAPLFDNVFVAPKMRSTFTDNISSEQIRSALIGYQYQSNFCKIGVRAFLITQQGARDVLTFYHDGYHSFVNYALTGIGKIMQGIETSIDFSLQENLSVQLIGALGDYRFNSRQQLVVSSDNDASVLEKSEVYVKNFKVARTPQRAAAINISYRPGSFFTTISAHYMDKRWMSFNPIRRTYGALALLDTMSVMRAQITEQTQLSSMFTLGALLGQSIRWYSVKNKTPKNILCILSINNILQSSPVLAGGYEQLRFDVAGLNVNKFPPKYFLGYGFNFSATISFTF